MQHCLPWSGARRRRRHDDSGGDGGGGLAAKRAQLAAVLESVDADLLGNLENAGDTGNTGGWV